MEVTQNITLHFDEESLPGGGFYKQADFQSRKLRFFLVSEGNEVTPDSSRHIAVINARRPDGEKRSYSTAFENSPVSFGEGCILFSLTKWCLEKKGTLSLEVSLIAEDENSQAISKITTETLDLHISKAVRTDTEIEEEEDRDILIELLNKTTNVIETLTNAVSTAVDEANETTKAVRKAYDNGDFKLRFEEMSDEQKEEMYKGLPVLDADDLDLYQEAETGLVHIVYRGQISENAIPLSASGGGGGGGGAMSNAQMMITNTSGFLSKSISKSEECILSASWESTEGGFETGNGTLTISGLTEPIVRDVKQGEVSFDVSPYLRDGENKIKFKITDAYGTSKLIRFTINVVVLTVSSTFNPYQPFNDDVDFFFVPEGDGDKTAHYILDGEEIYPENGEPDVFTESGDQHNFTVSKQRHGSHTFEVYFTINLNGIDVPSNSLYYDLIFTEAGHEEEIIASEFRETKAEQYIGFAIPFMVFSPTRPTVDVDFYINGEHYQTFPAQDRRPHEFPFSPDEDGALEIEIRAGSAQPKKFTLNVEKSKVNISAVTSDLKLCLLAKGRSNEEAHPEIWEDKENGISAKLENFGFVSDGWKTDDDKNVCLRVSGGARVTIPYKLFGEDFRAKGKTIEIEFATREVLNYDAVIMSCINGGRGLVVTPQLAKMTAKSSEIKAQYKEDEHVRLTLVVEKMSKYRYIYMYLDGVMCGIVKYPDGTGEDFQQEEPVDIVIGNDEVTVDLYAIRVYDNDLTRKQVLNNFIADTQQSTLRKQRFERNDVYDAKGNITIDKLSKDLPYMIVTTPVMPKSKDSSETKYVDIVYIDPVHPEKSFVAHNVEWKVQGTSSETYYRKNFKGKFPGFIYNEDKDNEVTESKYAIRTNSVPVKTFTYKADVASSEGANNVELVRIYNDFIPDEAKPPQMRENSSGKDIRCGIDGFPIVMFHDNGKTTSFYGKMNFNNDKGTGEVFGFEDGDEWWSVEKNSTNLCLFKSAEGTDEDYLASFEAEYPKDNTDVTRLRTLLQWFESVNQELATGEALTEPVTFEKTQYTHDTAEYRLAKYKAELHEHFNVDNVTYFYLYTLLFLLSDSRAKNSILVYSGKEQRWYLYAYDMDTALGINNEGKLEYSYNLEDTDQSEGEDVYNGQQSSFFTNHRMAFAETFPAMYNKMRRNITYDEVEKRFEEHQSKWCEAIFNEDSYYKCIEPDIVGYSNIFLPMLQGNKKAQRQWWLWNRFKYIDSKFVGGDIRSDYVDIKAFGTADFVITPYADMYVDVEFDGRCIPVKATRNEPVTVPNLLDDANNSVIRIFGASQMKDIGDLSGVQPKLLNVSMATKIQRLKVGDPSPGYVNTQLTEFTVGTNKLLRSIDCRNCVNLGTGVQTEIDISGCQNIEEVYFENTAIKSVKLPEGGRIKKLHLPASLTALTVINQPYIEDFIIQGRENLQSLYVEKSSISTKEIVQGMPKSKLTQIRLVDVDWSFENFAEIEEMMNRLDAMSGIKEDGLSEEKAVITGKWRIHSLTSAQLREINERYSWIDIIYDELILSVSFLNFDGTELLSTTVKRTMEEGGKLDPIAQGLIQTPQKPDDTEGEERRYFFSHWDSDNENILDDTVFTAQFIYKRIFYITFLGYDGALLRIVQALDGEMFIDPVSSGEMEAPGKPSENGILYGFAGWNFDFDNEPVTESMTVTPVYVEKEGATVTFMNGDEVLYSISVPPGSDVDFDYETYPTLERPQGVPEKAICAGFLADDGETMAARNLYSDIVLHAEWLVPRGGNSIAYIWYSDDMREVVFFGGFGKRVPSFAANSPAFVELYNTAERARFQTSIRIISQNGLLNYKNITEFTVNSWIEELGVECCRGISSLKKVRFEKGSLRGHQSLSGNQFAYSPAIEEVHFPSLEYWCEFKDLSGLFNRSGSGNLPINVYIDGELAEGELVLPADMTNIPKAMFANLNNRIESVVLHNSINSIQSYAFYKAESLEYINIPDSVLTIGERAFQYCSSLRYINAQKATSIGTNCFSNSGVEEVIIPSVTVLEALFANCRNFERLTISTSKLTGYKGGAFYSCGKFKYLFIDDMDAYCRLTLPDSISSAPFTSSYNGHIYVDDVEITEITIPEGVTTISREQYRGLRSVTKFTVPASVTLIKDGAFSESSTGCIIDLTKATVINGELSVEFGSNIRYGSGSILLFANEETANVAKVTTNISSYSKSIHYVGEVY